jgi:RNA polymerase sigma-70 factor (ECF subfamily)
MTDDNQSQKREWMQSVLDRFEGPLTRYAAQITGDVERARDVVQDTFVRLCDEDRERLEEHLAEWLFTVCRNRALDVRRKESRSRPLGEGQLEACESADPSPSMIVERREATSEVLQVIQTLPENQQEVIRLKFQNGLSYREISQVTHLSVTNVGFLLHTAIKTVRLKLKADSGVAQKT